MTPGPTDWRHAIDCDGCERPGCPNHECDCGLSSLLDALAAGRTVAVSAQGSVYAVRHSTEPNGPPWCLYRLVPLPEKETPK